MKTCIDNVLNELISAGKEASLNWVI